MEAKLTDRVHERIRVSLAKKNLKQTDLAQRLGWSETMISRRIRGLIPISTDDLDEIAQALEIPVDELVGAEVRS